jgi:dTDP-4-amino-4,6-dideoxygalactose transaminase
MAPWRVPLADVALAEDDIEAVAEVYRSGWLSMGPRTEQLERELERFTGAPHALAVASGTAGLHLMCAALGLGPGDEVIVPSMTFVATVNAVRYCAATPVFADIAGLTAPWLSAKAAEAAITARTRAILTVAYGGHPGETEALRRVADRHGLALLEDAAHAIGGRAGSRHLGTLGAAGAFSFFANKNVAIGEGGAVVCDDDDLAGRMRLMRSHGMTSLTWDRHRGHATGYDVVALGFNFRIDEPRAALATRQLARLDAANARRRQIAARYCAGLTSLQGISPAPAASADGGSARHLFTVVLEPDLDRAVFRARLAEQGIQTSLHYPPAHRFALYAEGAPDLPTTDAYAARAVTLPLFAHMTDAQVDLVVECVAAALPLPA